MRKQGLNVIVWATVAAVFCLGSVAIAQVSPAGDGEKTWDFTVSGANRGSAYLTFKDDFTVWGYIVVTLAPRKTTGDMTSGAWSLSGQWAFDQQGQVVGYLECPPQTDIRLDIRDFLGNVDLARGTMTIKGESGNGPLSLKGTPAKLLTDLTGRWAIKKTITIDRYKKSYMEIYNLEYWGYNTYYFTGKAADRCVFGVAQLSKRDNLGIVIEEYEVPDDESCEDVDTTTRGFVSVAVGRMNFLTNQARLKGDGEGSTANSVRMEVKHSPFN